MATKLYIGVNNIARKATEMYVGVNNAARKAKKGYIGVNGIARLFYEAIKFIPFYSIPYSSTGWTDTTTKQATLTNTYGTWVCDTSQARYNTTWYVSYMFEGSTSSGGNAYEPRDPSSDTDIILSCPSKVSICPTEINLCIGKIRDSVLYGLNIETNNWDILYNIAGNGDYRKSYTANISTSNYYNKFKISLTSRASIDSQFVSKFWISKGTLRIEG